MSEAYKTGRKQQKKEKKSKKAAATQSEGPKQSEKGGKGKTEFEGIETRRRVNDIAEAPPELPTLRRKASSGGGGAKLDGVVSGVQQRMMEEERLRAIERYRAMKQRQQQQQPSKEDKQMQLAAQLDDLDIKLKEINALKAQVEKEFADF